MNAVDALLSTHCAAQASAVFSETRYALNGDLRVAYRASREGPRDVVVVPSWFTCCEVIPEIPSIQGWAEAMTSLGRLIFFDQPGMGASDPVTLGALPTFEQWSDSITAVLDDLGSHEAVLIAFGGALHAALFAATHPSRTTALVVLEGYAHPLRESPGGIPGEEAVAMWGTGEIQRLLNPDMPWIAEFLTGHRAEVADDRVLATVVFTDIVDSTCRAALARTSAVSPCTSARG